MRVTFHHPPVFNLDGQRSETPFIQFQCNNPAHYPLDAGVYIYGLRLIVDGHRKFVPLYVGIAEILKKRLYDDHWSQESILGGKPSLKEIFNFSPLSFTNSEIVNRYNDMLTYDSLPNSVTKVLDPQIYLNPSLIWYQDMNFYNLRLLNLYLFGGDMNHLDTIKPKGLFDRIIANVSSVPTSYASFPNIKSDIEELRCAIKNTKSKFDTDYYFVYASLKDHIVIENHDKLEKEHRNYLKIWKKCGESFCNTIEKSTKIGLNNIGIHTTAKAIGKTYPIEIDLSEIQDCLVNTGGHPFNSSTGVYNCPLTVMIP